MDRPDIKMTGAIIDCPDVEQLTRFYEELLGWDVEVVEGPREGFPPADGFTRLNAPDGHGEIEIQFDEHFVPADWPGVSGGQCKQIHIDFQVEDLEAGIAWATRCGARLADHQPTDRNLDHLRVMIDPAGHPFCLWA